MKLIPSKLQWKNWTLPSKIGYVSFVIGILSILLAIVIPLISESEKIDVENGEGNVNIINGGQNVIINRTNNSKSEDEISIKNSKISEITGDGSSAIDYSSIKDSNVKVEVDSSTIEKVSDRGKAINIKKNNK
ncbi:hypothetical protein [Arenibacter sp. S6351L]|uniref:hypothetical protein n=1 Tax=Arenibacter sp. S6351L TaxID=2926407 RepID=UPI001FF393F4|nr:hypothetical protein [Arenibacter sp. S6351L]MCK0133676.1 hypothetical protein [Arenibacter sp. S6351L]